MTLALARGPRDHAQMNLAPSLWPALVVSLMTAACGGAAASAPQEPGIVQVTHAPDAPKKHKVVYHLSEAGADKAKFVLTNIKNHAEGVGWKDIGAMELVAHGPAVKTFMAEGMDADLRGLIDKLVADGLVLTICGNTMTKQNLPKEQLVKGCSIANKGGVVRLMELQEQGYTYLRP